MLTEIIMVHLNILCITRTCSNSTMIMIKLANCPPQVFLINFFKKKKVKFKVSPLNDIYCINMIKSDGKNILIICFSF